MAKTYINKVTFVTEMTTPDGKTVRVILPESMVLDFSAGVGFKTQIVEELPATGDPRTIYLVPSEDEKEGNIYVEWLYIDGEWECVGSTKVPVNLMIGTEAERLAFVNPSEGMQWNETHAADPEDESSAAYVVSYIFENGAWKIITSAQNLMVGTQAQRLAFSAYEGLQWNQVDGEGIMQSQWLYKNGRWIDISGDIENVLVQLSAPTEVDWTQLSVLVQNITHNTSQSITLDENGEAVFTVPVGELYEVTLPAVTGYVQPTSLTLSASQPIRNITHEYSDVPVQYEQVNIEADLHTSGSDTQSIFDNLLVYARDTNGEKYEDRFDSNGQATLSIPFGKHYTLVFPDVQGYYHDHTGEEHTAGTVSREVLVNYYEIGIGVYGVKADGTKLRPSEIAEQIAAGTLLASEIVAGYYNDSYLATANRGDGTTGCGFMWRITNPTTSGVWANPSVDINQSLMPYRGNETAALADCAGNHNTRIMDEVITDASSTTIAHTLRNSQSWVLTINGVDRQGFLPAYGQIKRLVNNRTDYEALYTALGLTAPAIWSGDWWTSCQYGAGNAVILRGGGFYYIYKYYSYSVLCCFDL